MKRQRLTTPSSRSLASAALRLLCALALVAHLCPVAVAQQGGSYEIKQSVVASGGATSSGGAYQLTGTTGQPAVGSSSGGFFTLLWGFWHDAEFLQLFTTATALPLANWAGWHNQDPTITLTATGGTPPRSINYSATGAQTIAPTTVNSSSTSLDINQEGTTTLNYHATDAANNTEATQMLIVRLDKTAPGVAITSPTATDYDLNEQVQAFYGCSDSLSGVESCVGTTPNQSFIDTSAAGTYNFNVTGTERAGNQTVRTVTYTVSSAPPPAGRKIMAADGDAGDFFGQVVAISGDTAIVGTPGDDNGARVEEGSAYIFERSAGGANNWGLVKKLIAPDAVLDDRFGAAVAISSDLAVVGKPTAGVFQSGAAYIFSRNAGGTSNWGLVKKLEVDEFYGSVVGISGDTVIVGGGPTGPGQEEPNKIYVFRRNAGGVDNWGEVKVIQHATDSLGLAAISGNTIIAGVPSSTNSPNGKALIFERDAGGADNWGQVKTLPAPDAEFGALFGGAVAIEDDRIVVGEVSPFTQGGSAYVFERNAGGANNWGQVKKIVAPDAAPQDNFGNSVGVSGGKIVVGASRADIGGVADQGAAYVFERNNGGANNWGFVRKLTATTGGASDDLFGGSVAISGNTIIVGEPYDDIGPNTDQGSAYIFDNQ